MKTTLLLFVLTTAVWGSAAQAADAVDQYLASTRAEIRKELRSSAASAYVADLYSRALSQDDVKAITELGLMTSMTKRDPAGQREACDHFVRAAELGFAPAQFLAGECYAAGTLTGNRAAEIKRWYEAAAAQGAWSAQCALGRLLMEGALLDRNTPHGFALCEEAASKGSPSAAVTVAKAHIAGWTGSPDYSTAARYLEAATREGNAEAAYLLSILHFDGLRKLDSQEQALKLSDYAAKRSHVPAFILSARYRMNQLTAGRIGNDAIRGDFGWRLFFWATMAERHDLDRAAKREARRILGVLKQAAPADVYSGWANDASRTRPAQM